MNIINAANKIGINYENAKAIYRTYRQEGRVKKKIRPVANALIMDDESMYTSVVSKQPEINLITKATIYWYRQMNTGETGTHDTLV